MGDGYTEKSSSSTGRYNYTRNNQVLKPCRDGSDCLLQHDGSTQHNKCFSHPCRWLDQCRDVDKNEHTQCFTHSADRIEECRYGSNHCTKLCDPEHRRTYRHDGLPYFLKPCKNFTQCRDRSTDHLKMYKHTPDFYQKTNSSTAKSVLNRKEDCRYGAGCRQKTDRAHCERYEHPIAPSSWSFAGASDTLGKPSDTIRSSFNDNSHSDDDDDDKEDFRKSSKISGSMSFGKQHTRDNAKFGSMPDSSSSSSPFATKKQECRYGANCRDISNPQHRERYQHPMSSSIPSSGASKSFVPSSKYNNNSDDDDHNKEDFERKDYKITDRISVGKQYPGDHAKFGSMPDSSSSSSPFATKKQECRYGAYCREMSNPQHCERYQHPMSSTLPFAGVSNIGGPSSNKNSTGTRTARIPKTHDDNEMTTAYSIGGAIALEKLSIEQQTSIKNMPKDAIIVVPGTYDHIDEVLTKLKLKYTIVEQHEIMSYPFRSDQTVYVNCAKTFPSDAAHRLRQLVEKGLHLITTDWALVNVLEVAFSGFVRYNGRSTADDVVDIDVVDPRHAFVKGFINAAKHAKPQWWLETSSLPIEIINRTEVKILIRSQSLYEKYQSDAVVVTFDVGRGNVTHMISHSYLQRSESAVDRHKMSAEQYGTDVNASDNVKKLISTEGQKLSYAQIQSSSTSAQFMYNLVSTRLSSISQSTSSKNNR